MVTVGAALTVTVVEVDPVQPFAFVTVTLTVPVPELPQFTVNVAPVLPPMMVPPVADQL